MATKRGYYREELKRSVDNIEMALTHLARVVEAYNKDHADIAELVTHYGNILVQVADKINQLHDSI